ncbi:hypothetical protein [Amycolatopsis tolypomycina]|uniref:Uncharacterized protein n=1 Tax=Amycolatopsis tolypomycina TaxID=208445 RepID=A0A1H4U7L3_9PSEU|nr:hypothetical protein [Amycolatopsis tolypomycina]SEC64388.1 hypothetical protein SAMN04489727_4518 [Amycolatopsis tolypomycina]
MAQEWRDALAALLLGLAAFVLGAWSRPGAVRHLRTPAGRP